MATATKKAAKKEVNKAEEIRKMFDVQGKDARPKDVIAALEVKGITVSSAQVSNVKTSLGGKKAGRKGKASSNGHLNLEALLATKALAAKLGGVEALKAALSAIEKLS